MHPIDNSYKRIYENPDVRIVDKPRAHQAPFNINAPENAKNIKKDLKKDKEKKKDKNGNLIEDEDEDKPLPRPMGL